MLLENFSVECGVEQLIGASVRFIILIFVASILTGCNEESKDSEPTTNKNYEVVYINDGAIQCESEGLSEKESAQIMIEKGIDVIDSNCAYRTGVEYEAKCGLGDGNINVHTIHSQSLPDAQALGFESVSTLRIGNNIGYEDIECPKSS